MQLKTWEQWIKKVNQLTNSYNHGSESPLDLEKPIKKIGIMVITNLAAAFSDPQWCETSPLGGSEASAVHLSSSLRALGFDVEIFQHDTAVKNDTYDVFISLRFWEIFASGVRPGRLNYLWCQDDIDQQRTKKLFNKEIADKVYAACDGIIMLSHYQRSQWTQYLHAPYDKIFLTTNGILLNRFDIDRESLAARPPTCYYASTPFRGLAPLLKAWPLIKKTVPQAELHVFSSMQIYGMPEEQFNSETNRQYYNFQPLYDLARSLDGVSYHGSVGNARIREAASKSRVLAYPCIFPETSCITAMEAMASGCVVVGSALGALPETAWLNPLVHVEKEEKNSYVQLDQWTAEVCNMLENDAAYLPIAQRNLNIASSFDWGKIAPQWIARFYQDLKGKNRLAGAIASLERVKVVALATANKIPIEQIYTKAVAHLDKAFFRFAM